MKNDPEFIIVHHSGLHASEVQLAAIEELHTKRGFPRSTLGYHVGYHFVIEKDGTVCKTREEHEEGAHAKGQNFNSIGICLTGNFDIEQPNDAQIESFGALLSELAKRHNIQPENILPHRACNEDTHCFGLELPQEWAQRVYQNVETPRKPFL